MHVWGCIYKCKNYTLYMVKPCKSKYLVTTCRFENPWLERENVYFYKYSKKILEAFTETHWFFTIVNTSYEMIALKGIMEFRNVSISNGTNITYNRYYQRKRRSYLYPRHNFRSILGFLYIVAFIYHTVLWKYCFLWIYNLWIR